jgi:hypothetical protein
VGGTLVINGSSNTSSTTNGSYTISTTSTTIADSSSFKLYVGPYNSVNITGTRAATVVGDGGILTGTGTVGALTTKNGVLTPGGTTGGTLNSGALTLDSGTTFNEQIAGTSTGQWGQINVTGAVSLANAVLAPININGFTPALNNSFTIINNDGSDAVTGTFNGLAQNAKVTVNSYTYKISYTGGTGNDVTLTVTGTPGAPDTSGAISNPTNIAVAIGVIVAGFAVLVVRSKYLKMSQRVTVRSKK